MRHIAVAAAVLMVTSVFTMTTGVAGADTAPIDPTEPQTVAADSLPTVQIDGVVWDQVIVGNTVYVTGSFAKARPAGAAAGTNETDRANILAYDITTGALITTWAPSLNAQGRVIKASADGSTIYVGGDFTQVNGTTRNRVAALDAATGVLRPFNGNANGNVDALAVSGNTLYMGGAFTVVGNQPRSRLAAVNATTGAILPWAPTASLEVRALVVPAGKGKVIAGGHFDMINGVQTRGLVALDADTGATIPFPANQVVSNWGADAAIWSLSTNNDQVFGTGLTYLVNNNPTTGGNLEATFAADATTGNLIWVNGCRGDHYDSVPLGSVLYSVGHSHDCSSQGGNPQTQPWTFQRAQAETTYADPSGARNAGGMFNGRPRAQQLHWIPTLTAGTVTGQTQAAWTVEGDSRYVIMGGEFPRVNNVAQQGLARFAVKSIAPNRDAIQGYNELTPTLLGVGPGALRISWQAAWDRDNAQLTYEVLRGDTVNTSTVIATRTFSPSVWWSRPKLAFVDTTAAPGSTQTYRIRVKDAFNNGFASLPTTGTVPAGTATPSTYRAAVMAEAPVKYWRLGETSGTIGYDQVGADDLTLDPSAVRGAAGALIGDPDAATTFVGGTRPASTTGTAVLGSQNFTIETWFRTTTKSGGKIVGFGTSSTGFSSSYDRHLYMANNGQLYFGVRDSANRTVNSTASYNDGQWHQAVGQMGPSGLKLYVDGKFVADDPTATVAQAYSGFWRIGGDTLTGWPAKPNNSAFPGTIDEVSIYEGQLSQDQIRAHFLASGRAATWPAAPADLYGAAVWNTNPDLYLRLNETSGTSAVNRMTNDAAATATGTSWNGAPSPADPTGTSIQFTANNGRVVGTRQYTNPSTFSLEAWIRTTDSNGGRIIGFGDSNGQTSSNYDRHLYLLSNGRLRYGVWTGAAATIDSPRAVNDGQWHHVVVTQQPGEQKMYVDGSLAATGTASAQQSYSGYWRLGTDNIWDGDRNYIGLIDEAAVYSTVLSAQAVQSHWAAAGGTVVNLAPTASFTATPNGLAVGVDASASNDPDGTIGSYSWNWGDGTAADTGKTATHSYAAAGTYTVTLTVTDNLGATGTTTRSVTVTAPPPNQSPTASFTATPNGMAVGVDASASNDPDGTIASYSWNWGDGTAADTGKTASHTYSASGTYTVTLTVTDNLGATGTTSRSVTVTAPVVTNYATDTFSRTISNGLGAADVGGAWTTTGTAAGYSVAGGVGRVTVTAGAGRTITLGSVAATDTEVTTRLAFDKDQTGGGTYVSVIGRRIDASNDYRLKLRIQAGGAVSAQLTRIVGGSETVIQNLATVPGLNLATGEFLKVRYQVTGTNPTNLAARVWKEGSTEPSSWQLQATDTTAALQANGSVGIWDYLSGSATNAPITMSVDDFVAGPVGGITPPPVNQPPTAVFNPTVTNLAVSVDGSGSSDPDGSITSWSWSWGDNTADGTGQTANHTYAAAGTYTVTLKVTDNMGATGSVSKSVTVSNAATPVLFAQDGFARTVSNGWGTADVGGAWTVGGTASNYSVAGGVGRMSLTAGGNRSASLGSVSQSAVDVGVKLSMDKDQTGGGTYVAVIGRRVDASNDYRVKLRVQAGGAVTAQLVRVVAGTETVIQSVATVPGLTWAASDVLNLRFQVSGTGTTNLAAKFWKDGTLEPAGWTLQSTDTTAGLQAAGGVGLWAYLSGSATNAPIVLSVDDFSARPLA